MKKGLVLLLVLLVIGSVYAVKEIVVEETDLVKLEPQAYDPDDDEITYSFSEPLDSEGEWQTNYGDFGEYETSVTVSDSEASTTEEVLLIVEKKEEAPTIVLFSPDSYELSFKETEKIEFSVSASDVNGDELTYYWEIDSERVGEGDSFTYFIGYDQEGERTVNAFASDGDSAASHEWLVDVEDVDRGVVLEEFVDVEVDEQEIVRLKLPDFSKYNLEYNISEPIGNDGVWKTGYDDGGEHEVEIKVYDGEYEESKTVNIKVNNVDRKPDLRIDRMVFLREDQKVTIKLNGSDPDSDALTYSADDMPSGASIDGDVFSWYPGYDAVMREGVVNDVLDKYHLVSEAFTVDFKVKGLELESSSRVTFVVKDVNRVPDVVSLDNIVVNEGEEVIIKAEASDPDGDELKFSYSGWMNGVSRWTTYGDAGEYTVKVSASDGWLSDSEDVKVIVRKSNRAPVFKALRERNVREGEELVVELGASDADRDSLTFFVDNSSYGEIEGNLFKWVPDYDFVSKGDEAYANIVLSVSDGDSSDTQGLLVFVNNVNRVPVINRTNPLDGVKVKAGVPIVFSVDAIDWDKDRLGYKWDFGFFDKFDGKSKVKRTWTSKGNKRVRVTVSDGEEKVSYEWRVKVV
ncbi:MAG: PKD domain-containing protein [Candidatus Woesearchaeota archaeon]|nr:PKD domain-containing protein [Candidatus Woesearchaeota archaeon]